MNRESRETIVPRRSPRFSIYQGQPSVCVIPTNLTSNEEIFNRSQEELIIEHSIRSRNISIATLEKETNPILEIVQQTRNNIPDLVVPGSIETITITPVVVMAGRSATRLKYTRFNGDGHQDVDDWLGEFESTANANEEDQEVRLRIFQGLLKGEALRWYQDLDTDIKRDWTRLTNQFLQTFRESGGEARALGRLSKLRMKDEESVRAYSQRLKRLLKKLTPGLPEIVQVEWFVAGLPEDMSFQIRQARPATLRDAIGAAQNYEDSVQSLRQSRKHTKNKSRKKCKEIRRKKDRYRSSSSESFSSKSTTSDDNIESDTSTESSPPQKSTSHRTYRKGYDRGTTKVKVEVPEDKLIMREIKDTLDAIKVNLAENRKPRRPIPTSRVNVWCSNCRNVGHYPSECPKPKKVQFVDAEGNIFFTECEDEEQEDSVVYQINSTYGREKAPQAPFRVGNQSPRFLAPGSTPGTTLRTQQNVSFEKMYGLCFFCGEAGHFAAQCPQRLQGLQGAPLELPCQNCGHYGHDVAQCPQPPKPRPVFKQVEVPPRELTGLNYAHQEGVDKPTK